MGRVAHSESDHVFIAPMNSCVQNSQHARKDILVRRLDFGFVPFNLVVFLKNVFVLVRAAARSRRLFSHGRIASFLSVWNTFSDQVLRTCVMISLGFRWLQEDMPGLLQAFRIWKPIIITIVMKSSLWMSNLVIAGMCKMNETPTPRENLQACTFTFYMCRCS